jgi:hypothetical protein
LPREANQLLIALTTKISVIPDAYMAFKKVKYYRYHASLGNIIRAITTWWIKNSKTILTGVDRTKTSSI